MALRVTTTAISHSRPNTRDDDRQPDEHGDDGSADRRAEAGLDHGVSVPGRGLERPSGRRRVRVLMKRPYRVVVAKPGLDGHDRGAKTITRALRDAGFEVIYTGLHQTPEQIAETALQEDVDAVGLSLLSGAHLTLFPRVMEELRQPRPGRRAGVRRRRHPGADIATLKEQGVAEVFTPGSSLAGICRWLEETLDARRKRR